MLDNGLETPHGFNQGILRPLALGIIPANPHHPFRLPIPVINGIAKFQKTLLALLGKDTYNPSKITFFFYRLQIMKDFFLIPVRQIIQDIVVKEIMRGIAKQFLYITVYITNMSLKIMDNNKVLKILKKFRFQDTISQACPPHFSA
jgi:hypothetical protein